MARKLASYGVVVKEVMLRDILPPAEYANGMEGLLLKDQADQRHTVEMNVKRSCRRRFGTA